MVQLSYDILFSIGFNLVPFGDSPNKIYPTDWSLKATGETQRLMQRERMLFRVRGGTGLLLAEPARFEEDGDRKLAVFEISDTLRFHFEVKLSRPDLSKYLDLGPGPRDEPGTATFPEDLQTFFGQAFPNNMPVYALNNDRLIAGATQASVGPSDAVAPPAANLSFPKSIFSAIQLNGPLPSLNPISPNYLLSFEEGEEKQIENPTAYEFAAGNIPEGLYELTGNRVGEEDSETAFSGNIFLNKGKGMKPALIYLIIEIAPGTFQTEDLTFSIKLQEKIPLTLSVPES